MQFYQKPVGYAHALIFQLRHTWSSFALHANRGAALFQWFTQFCTAYLHNMKRLLVPESTFHNIYF